MIRLCLFSLIHQSPDLHQAVSLVTKSLAALSRFARLACFPSRSSRGTRLARVGELVQPRQDQEPDIAATYERISAPLNTYRRSDGNDAYASFTAHLGIRNSEGIRCGEHERFPSAAIDPWNARRIYGLQLWLSRFNKVCQSNCITYLTLEAT